MIIQKVINKGNKDKDCGKQQKRMSKFLTNRDNLTIKDLAACYKILQDIRSNTEERTRRALEA